MAAQATFIVRLYRRDARTLTGVVEHIESGVRVPFGSAAELWTTLRERGRMQRTGAAATSSKKPMRKGGTK
jgi:hypothetical protein